MFDSFLQLAEDWTVHLDANALVKKRTFDFLRATTEALQCDAGVLGEDQIGLDARQVRLGTYYIARVTGTNLAHWTKPDL